MELGVRDWIIIVGALVVFAIALEVFRSIRSHQRDNLRMSFRRKKEAPSESDDDQLNPELPSGGARVIAVRRSAEPSDGGKLHINEDVPVLMEPVSEEPAVTSVEEVELPPEPSTPVADGTENGDLQSQQAASPTKKAAQPASRAKKPSGETRKPKDDQKAAPEFQELIVLYVMARDKGMLKGSELAQILLACDMRFGKRQIFHRYENADGSGAEQFGVANLVEPGTFDLDNIDDFETPGVVFFLHLPGPEKPLEAFDCMAETARVLVKNLGCDMLDEAHSVATTQTIEHYRQRIRDFERKQLTLV